MKKKLFRSLVLSAFGVSLIGGVGVASAQGFGTGFGMGMGNFSPEDFASRQEAMFDLEADILGISKNEIKSAWAEGKDFRQIAIEKGIDTETLNKKMQAKREENIKAHLKALVDGGVITKAQADKRFEVMQTMMNSKNAMKGKKLGQMKGDGEGRGMMGMSRGFGF